MIIDRSDMLELTRRMTPSRNCFGRIAGAYMDREGFIDDYEIGEPDCGFLFPAFANRSTDSDGINIYQKNGDSEILAKEIFAI